MTAPAEIEPFLAHQLNRDRAPVTVALYRVQLDQFFTWFSQTTGQPAQVVNVTPLDVRQYREYLKGQHKPATVNRKLSALRVFMAWCVTQGHITANPAANIKPVTRAARAPKWLTRQQAYAVLRAAHQEHQIAVNRKLAHRQIVTGRTLAIVTLLLSTGLRVSELCALKLADVQTGPKSGLVIVRSGKGGKYREIPLNADGRKAVKTWLTLRAEKGDYLFHLAGEQLDRRLINWHLDQLGLAAGVKLTPHMLRHTFGKNLVDAGEPLDRVALLMGHSDINTTALYTLPSLSDLNQAVEKIAWSD